MVVLAFGVAIGAAAALVAAALLLRSGDDAPPPSTAPAVDVAGIPQESVFLGPASATVTLIEYADLQCPFCRSYAEEVLPTLVDEYVRPGRVRMEFRGLAFLGDDSLEALRYVQAAGLQSRLWQMQDALYRNQGSENSDWVTEDLARQVGSEIEGLDVDRMLEDSVGEEVTSRIDEAQAQATAAGVRGTPSFFVRIGNDEPYALELTALDPAQFRAALDDALEG